MSLLHYGIMAQIRYIYRYKEAGDRRQMVPHLPHPHEAYRPDELTCQDVLQLLINKIPFSCLDDGHCCRAGAMTMTVSICSPKCNQDALQMREHTWQDL